MKLSGPQLFFIGRVLIPDSISLCITDLFKFSGFFLCVTWT